MKSYDHKKIEFKWQKEWARKKIYQTKEGKDKNPKYYILDMFPYPSGDGLHVGHPKGYIATDVISRMKRMQGHNVLHPMGFDAFGLPAENFAIKKKIHPEVAVSKNIKRFKEQLGIIGLDYDWSREVITTDPKYYKWTQWIFLQLFKKGLAYESNEPINWCPSCKTGLANEDLEGGRCERCGSVVEKRPLRQWVLKITDYAERLLADLDLKKPDGAPVLSWPEPIKEMQRNWIGKSEGAEIEFPIISAGSNFSSQHPASTGSSREKTTAGSVIRVFTTRPDTLFGATYLVIAPDHTKLAWAVESDKSFLENKEEVRAYIEETRKKTELERTAEDKEKTGVLLKGLRVINPATGEEIPVWASDYVLAGYGTGAIMAVPAHDERDFQFAKKYNLPIKQVIMPDLLDEKNLPRPGKKNTERETVHVILRNPKKKEVLVQFLKDEKWKGLDPKTFIIGGIEAGETSEEAAAREIKEETGYKNFKFVEAIPLLIQAKFFAAHKDVNRNIRVQGLVFDLIDEKKGEITEDEFFNKDTHEMKWLPYDKVEETVTIVDDKLIWKYYQTGGFSYGEKGVLMNSGKFSGRNSEEVKKEIIEFVGGKEKTTYRLRDWVFSRQRYWGEPIPLIHCPVCGVVPVPEKDLPVKLPKVKFYEPTGTGESPLAAIDKWVNVKCPQCKGPAKRETNTMPQWAGSSWYYLRYMDPENAKAIVDPKKEKYWNVVDLYVGGAEHATRHLIYARFWHKFLFDIGVASTIEPFGRLQSVGLIMGQDGRKMSKRFGNVINPDDVVSRYGADTLRIYEMFMGPFDQTIAWSEEAIIGPRRFLERVWKLAPPAVIFPLNIPHLPARLAKKPLPAPLTKLLHKTIKKVTEDIEAMRFNTAISTMMIFVNEAEKSGIDPEDYKKFLQILAPFAPHMAEELWVELGEKKSIHISPWPAYDPGLTVDSEIKIALQVNGKVRAEMMIGASDNEEGIKERALKDPTVAKYLDGKPPKKVIYVKGRLINIVV